MLQDILDVNEVERFLNVFDAIGADVGSKRSF
jgi:hypothetical protein